MINATQVSNLKSLASSNETAQAALLMLALRERHTKKTDLGRFRNVLLDEGFTISNDKYKNFWTAMEKMEFGKLEYPRGKDNNAIFHWNQRMDVIGAAAFDEAKVLEFRKDHGIAPKESVKETVQEASPTKNKPGRPKGSKNKVKKQAKASIASVVEKLKEAPKKTRGRPVGSKNAPKGVLTKQASGSGLILYVPLRSKLVSFEVPANLSEKEADTICQAVRLMAAG